jgi:protein-S-isoprenylcysteine O-methyltransferase Ste14
MKTVHRVALVVLILEMPVPFYWLTLHGGVQFWRKRSRLGYLCGVLVAWGGFGSLLYHFRASLFSDSLGLGPSPILLTVAGLLLITLDAVILTAVEKELGGHRLVGHAEVTGCGEMTARSLYRWVRHPRYLGMILAVLGACLLGGSRTLWMAFAFWLAIALAMIWLEDRELRARFGPPYVAYARRVPALLPLGRARH